MNSYNIEFLRKQFLSCTPLNKVKWPVLLNNIGIDMQKQIINSTVNCELVLKYPIKQSYKKAFLKLFINKLEQSGVEIDDDVYNTYCNIIAYPNEQSFMYYRHFILNNEEVSDIFSIKESTSIISKGTTGLCSWKAAFYLAEWCIENKQEFKGKHILELGSGVGLTGLVIVNFCAPKIYYFSDGNSIVLKTLEENVRLNLLNNDNRFLWNEIIVNNKIQFVTTGCSSINNIKVNIINLKWEGIDKLSAEQIDVDVIIAADVLYDNNTFEPLVCGLKDLMHKTLNYAVIAATVRNESTIQEFFNILGKHNLLYREEKPLLPQIFVHCEETPVRIFKILRQNK